MKNRKIYLLFVLPLLFGMLAVASPVVNAQKGPVPTPTAQALRVDATPSPGDKNLSFYQLGQENIQLVGPMDYEAVVFGLPADWQVNAAVELTLFIDVAFDSLNTTVTTADGQVAVNSGGTLMLEYNREEIGVFPITKAGEMMLRVQVPVHYVTPVRDDLRQEFTLTFDSALSCLLEQQMSIVVKDTSYITVPHTKVFPSTDLVQFPYPLYQDAVFPDVAAVVIPDEPSAQEVQSALTVIAGLSKLSNSNLVTELVSLSEFNTALPYSNHVILIGKTAWLPFVDQLALPLAPVEGAFVFANSAPTDGVIQMVNSPWDSSRMVLVVSGDTDEAVVKAAQAVSTGRLRPNTSPNLSVVRTVQADVKQYPQNNIDQSLQDLGYETEVLDRRGVDSALFRFYVPPGSTTGPDAYFELAFGHSALLDFERSGLNVELNGQPIGSVRFTEKTASGTINTVLFSLPSSVITQGLNDLEVIASLQPLDECSSSQLRGIWANVWSSSHLHLPLVKTTIAPKVVSDLATYPAPFSLDASMQSISFILQPRNIESWRMAANIAAYLGNRSDGAIYLLNASFADSIPPEVLDNMNLILVGNAQEMPIVNQINDSLPAPFESASGFASEESLQVSFKIPPTSPVGYVQLLNSPWNQDRLILAALGNNPQGVAWAASGLYDAHIRSQLAGNFAIINNQQVTTADTRLAPPQAGSTSSAEVPAVAVVPPTVSATALADAARPSWLLPALQVSIGLTIFVALLAMIAAIRRARSEKKMNRRADDEQD